MQSQYLSHHNLHFKPISARIASACLFAKTELNQRADLSRCQGRAMVILSKVTTIAGALLLIPIALIEAVAALAIAVVADLLNKHIFFGRSEFLQKYSLMSYSYSTHCVGVCVLAAKVLVKPSIPDFHLFNMGADRFLHFGTAALVQIVIGSRFDRLAGRHRLPGGDRFGVERAIHLVTDHQNEILNDLGRSLMRDLGSNLNNLQIPSIQDFMSRHQEDQDLLVNPLRNFRDPARRPRMIGLIRAYLQEANLLRPSHLSNPNVFELNGRDQNEIAYQDYMQRLVKDSVLEIYQTPELVKCLSDREDEQDGKDSIAGFYPNIYVPVANYAQYKELLKEENHCPAEFRTADLRVYNDRRGKIETLKTDLGLFTPEEKDALVQKILKPDRFNVENTELAKEGQERVKKLFRSITELAGSLHQGKLLCRYVVDANSAELGISSANYFQRAFMDAVAEIPSEETETAAV